MVKQIGPLSFPIAWNRTLIAAYSWLVFGPGLALLIHCQWLELLLCCILVLIPHRRWGSFSIFHIHSYNFPIFIFYESCIFGSPQREIMINEIIILYEKYLKNMWKNMMGGLPYITIRNIHEFIVLYCYGRSHYLHGGSNDIRVTPCISPAQSSVKIIASSSTMNWWIGNLEPCTSM